MCISSTAYSGVWCLYEPYDKLQRKLVLPVEGQTEVVIFEEGNNLLGVNPCRYAQPLEYTNIQAPNQVVLHVDVTYQHVIKSGIICRHILVRSTSYTLKTSTTIRMVPLDSARSTNVLVMSQSSARGGYPPITQSNGAMCNELASHLFLVVCMLLYAAGSSAYNYGNDCKEHDTTTRGSCLARCLGYFRLDHFQPRVQRESNVAVDLHREVQHVGRS